MVIIGLHVACIYVHLKESKRKKKHACACVQQTWKARQVLVILDLEKIVKGHGISSVGLGVMKPICVRIWEYAEEESSIPA